MCSYIFLCFYTLAPPELIPITDVPVTVLQDNQLMIEAPYPVSGQVYIVMNNLAVAENVFFSCSQTVRASFS